MNKTKKVLIIAYLFPPIGGGGVQRALKMAKYLGAFGWQVHVLTVDTKYHVSLDHSLLEQLPPEVKIHRIKEFTIGIPTAARDEYDEEQQTHRKRTSFKSKMKEILFPILKKTKQYLLIPDDQTLWYPRAYSQGVALVKKHQIDVLFSTSGPYTNHLVGRDIKRKTGIPWIADFRDPWTQNMHGPKIAWRKKIEEKMERSVLQDADILLTVTHSFATNFQEKFGEVIKRTEVIHNGFDLEDYLDLEQIQGDRDRFTFIYAGIFYQERNPRLFLTAIAELLSEQKLDRATVELKFAGVFDYPGYTENLDCVRQLKLEDVVHVLGHLPHHEALIQLKKADVLLLISDTVEGSGHYIPGKLYEYMAIKKPILALSLAGESTEIIETFQLGQVVNPDSKEEIKEAVLILYEQWKQQDRSTPHTTNRIATHIYERKAQAGMLAELLEQITT